MDADTIEKIVQLARTEQVKVGDKTFTTAQVFNLPQPEPAKLYHPKTLEVNTLDGLVSWMKSDMDSEDIPAPYLIHVKDPNTVELVSGLQGDQNERSIYVRAQTRIFDKTVFEYGQYMENEWFIIALMTLFSDEGPDSQNDRDYLMKLVSAVKDENVTQAMDNSIAQTVKTQSGSSFLAAVTIKNPVWLAPYRTFREVEQPPSPFVVRMKSGKPGSLPTTALFECDGQEWKLKAIKLIAEYLREALGETGRELTILA